VQQIFPDWNAEVDPLDSYLRDARPAPPGRPWVMLNMIASLDGATALDGLSGGLGGPCDRAVLAALRACCDWILVASGTANAERYRMPKGNPAARTHRLQKQQTAAPRLAIVTASGKLDPTIPALANEGQPRPLVISGTLADAARLSALNAEIVRLPMPKPQPQAVLQTFHERGATVVLCEGGPTWNGQMLRAGVVDEMCISISPILVGGDSPRVVAAAPQTTVRKMRLRRLLTEDGLLFARYTRI